MFIGEAYNDFTSSEFKIVEYNLKSDKYVLLVDVSDVIWFLILKLAYVKPDGNIGTLKSDPKDSVLIAVYRIPSIKRNGALSSELDDTIVYICQS